MNFRGNPTRKSTCGEWLNSSAVSLWLVRRAGIWFSAPKTGAQNHFLCGRTHTHRKSLKYLQPKKLRCFFSCCIVSLCAGGRRGRLFVSSLGLGWSLGLRVRLSCTCKALSSVLGTTAGRGGEEGVTEGAAEIPSGAPPLPFCFLSWLRVWGGVLGQKMSARKEREKGWFLFSPSCQMSAYWLCVTNTRWRQAWDVTTYSTVISKIKFPIRDRLQWRALVVYLLRGRRK